MEDITKYCSWADDQLNSTGLPPELRTAILQSRGGQYLETLARLIRISGYSDKLFSLYRPLVPELAARWTSRGHSLDPGEPLVTLSCMARLLPFAPYIRPHVNEILQNSQTRIRLLGVGSHESKFDDGHLTSLLLAFFRLLSYDRDGFSELITPVFFSSLFHHPSQSTRYLAVQCLCLTMHFADAFAEKLLAKYIGSESIPGTWEDKKIDYRLLKLREEDRWMRIESEIRHVEAQWQGAEISPSRALTTADFSPQTASVGGVLLLRDDEILVPRSTFVLTSTARANLHELGGCLREQKPILMTGQAGSGKTSLILEAARLLNKLSSMIVLHLNEQTDAKSLLGMYTSSADGESFEWRPGVLTKAVQQGRWVIVEDIDRAPSEVLGVLRPVLETSELFLAGRKERVRPKDGFRVFATIRTAGDSSPRSGTSRHTWMTNPRLWSHIHATEYHTEEVQEILYSKYNRCRPLMNTIMRAHESLCDLYRQNPHLKAFQSRAPSLRDLLKWCRRTASRLQPLHSVGDSFAIPERTKLDIFKDAVDCYAGYLPDEELQDMVAACIAQEMGISPQHMRHCLAGELVVVSETGSEVQIGRSSLQKVTSRRRTARGPPFALTRPVQRTLERISASTSHEEPCLLVGETGVGKTTLVQHIANLVGQKLTVINLSQQSEASDLLGGLKPITTRSLILPEVERFNALFDDTFSTRRNEKFQMALSKALAKQNWPRLLLLWQEAVKMAEQLLTTPSKAPLSHGSAPANKRRKLATAGYATLRQKWTDFSATLSRIKTQLDRGDKNHAFAFVEGKLVQAVRNGEWLLLDEINLASPDTLDHIVSLLQDDDNERAFLLLAEAGHTERIIAHPNFRVFAAMNPATDAGKKDLSLGLRSRLTEIYVQSGDNALDDLVKIIQTYLGDLLQSDARAAIDLGQAYLGLKKLNQEHRLSDGAGDVPHFSIRSLVRCLLYVLHHTPSHGLRRAMYEGFAMSFFTVLNRASEALALPILEKNVLSNVKHPKSFLAQQPKMSYDEKQYVAFRHHLVMRGPETPDLQPHYIRTPSVERNLLNLARAASMRRFPILLQGPTSAGKTSMVEYLAKLSGNKFVRINNHEHTDLQEYLGNYASGADGQLQYLEGVLVEALRQGHWIVLDELNLAPSDVLEALNRLLDDNRELLIPETQEVVRPHPNFMLFATQNPASLYGGRKRLSRAFRNRFLELHFDDIPEDELEVILRERAQIAPSFCAQIVSVYKKLSLQRQSTRLFEQRNSFATLRDLFRWAARPVDDRQQLAHHGFMLLAERVRDPAERGIVRRTIEETMKVVIDENVLYGMSAIPVSVQSPGQVVWTPAMRRLFVLVSEALKNNEPVLLVGETGCGKTQICQVVAEAFGRPLNTYNAHTNTETGDLIGSQRPIRHRSELTMHLLDSFRDLTGPVVDGVALSDLHIEDLIERFNHMDTSAFDPGAVARIRSNIGAFNSLFAWHDGSLVRAMKLGEHFLLDEISLADDSVLERLNSVLEPSRTILLAEKGAVDNLVNAQPGFQFLATMNPGGDYGKRELSAALRNRLTEIWVPPLSQEADVLPILTKTLNSDKAHLAEIMLRFATWFRDTFHNFASNAIPLRALLTWVEFVNRMTTLPEALGIVHGALMVYIDSLGANPAGMTATSPVDVGHARVKSLQHLQTLIGVDVFDIIKATPEFQVSEGALSVGPFSVARTADMPRSTPELVFGAPTTLKNTMRIVRALQMARPILLEGSPGVGKTAIVTALAQALGKQMVRINLSDQTDLMDLFGADAPMENERMGRFSWRNGPLLDAMQRGGWVLLDEMNLASQSVLEGLNSCLDHRHEVYIAELDKSFVCHPEFTLFAAQNPHHQGGGRKGLPASFVNRFTVVYADPFQEEDLMCICRNRFPSIPENQLETVVSTIVEAERLISSGGAFGQGAPWEFNLRDVNRWLSLCQEQVNVDAACHFNTIVARRFRSALQRSQVEPAGKIHCRQEQPESFYNNLTPTSLQIGTSFLARDTVLQRDRPNRVSIAVHQLPAAKSIITAVSKDWPVILTGPSGSGKTTILRSIASLAGAELVEFSMNADVDTIDLIGGFEQYDPRRDLSTLQKELGETLQQWISASLRDGSTHHELDFLLSAREKCQSENADHTSLQSVVSNLSNRSHGFDKFAERLSALAKVADQIKSRFVWNDGILIDCLQKGSWLVLDNANLCNPSVLDRLNSLLEPDGKLVISEQHNAEQGARVIAPHPTFRIFLTVDPRYGELSRAMRNRSLEVFLDPDPQLEYASNTINYADASSIHRLRSVREVTAPISSIHAVEACLDSLSNSDMKLLESGIGAIPESNIHGALGTELAIMRLSPENGLWSQIHAALAYLCYSGVVPVSSTATQPQLLTINEPLFQLRGSASASQTAATLTRVWFLVMQHAQITAELTKAAQRAAVVSPQDMTLLDKSLLVGQKSRKNSKVSGNDAISTYAVPPVYYFVQEICDQIAAYLQRVLRNGPRPQDISGIASTLSFLTDLISFFQAKSLDTSLFQAYLQVAKDVGSGLAQGLVSPYANALRRLGSENVLNSGLSIQRMWQSWKPRTAATQTQLRVQLTLESLIRRFDELSPVLPQSRKELAAIRTKMVLSLEDNFKNEQPQGAIEALQDAVTDLETQASSNFRIEGHFVAVFDQLYQRLLFQHEKDDQLGIELLAMFSTSSLRSLSAAEVGPSVPTALERLASLDDCGVSQLESTGLLLLDRLSTVSAQPLGMLNFAREELYELARTISSHDLDIGDVLKLIMSNAQVVLAGLLSSHRDLLTQAGNGCFGEGNTLDVRKLATIPSAEIVTGNGQVEELFRWTYAKHLRPAVLLLTPQDRVDIRDIGSILIHLSLAGLVLMVPDRPFDPALYPALLSNFHGLQISSLASQIRGWREFHQRIMGQDSCMIIRTLDQDLQDLGDPPPAPQVVRPTASGLSRLQDKFSNILRSIVSIQPDQILLPHLSQKAELELEGRRLTSNVKIMVERLANVNRAYDDLVKPVIWLLKWLSIGTQFLLAANCRKETDESPLNEAVRHTPMLSSEPVDIQNWPMPTASQNREVNFHWLSHWALSRSVTHVSNNLGRARSIQEFLSIIETFYVEWKLHLTRDQDAAEKQSRYYTYRGDTDENDEAEQQEMAQLFPNFDQEDGRHTNVASTKYDAQAVAVKLAELHHRLYTAPNAQDRLREYLVEASQLILVASTAATHGQSLVSTTDILPAVLFQMELKSIEMESDKDASNLNIYTDTSVTESQKLLTLVQSVRARFHEIQARWPEHAIPAEVGSFCDQILHLTLTDPIGKLLTKAEKLLEIISQWQSVASREWSVTALIEELTALIISWRRLELFSWSKLLELEKRKQEEGARAWYFIAYEAVIYNSTQILEQGGDIETYCQELARTLEEFLKNTTLGQYTHRLTLLEDLNKTLGEAANFSQRLRPMFDCVTNVVHHYRRYEPNIMKSLETGHAELERAIHEQIKLASWKDTNVIALRESAKRSHFKLFKIVKKYRALLNQPMSSLKSTEISVDGSVGGDVIVDGDPPDLLEKLHAALRKCSQIIPEWHTRPERLTDPLGSARSMRRLYADQGADFRVHLQLMSFRDDLNSSIKELRSQTPATLTDENSAYVRHLQERKRRLFAETLKNIAQMGVRRNLPTSELNKQSSTAVLLAQSPDLSPQSQSALAVAADDAFHELLEYMPQIRSALSEHSDDLTDGEVSRGAGLLEGLLAVTIQQRAEIGSANVEMQKLESNMLLLRSLHVYDAEEYQRSVGSEEKTLILLRHLSWLSEILVLAHRILSFQSRVAKLEINQLLETMETHSGQLKDLMNELQHVGKLPQGVTSPASLDLEGRCSAAVVQLGDSLRDWQVKEPRTKFLLRRIIPWTEKIDTPSSSAAAIENELSLSDFDPAVKDVTDQVFVALQQLPALREKMPTSTEDHGWVTKSGKYLSGVTRALHVDAISGGIQSVLGQLQHLRAEDLGTGVSLLLLSSPILEQYYLICRSVHERHASIHLETCRLAVQLAKSFTPITADGLCRPSELPDGQEKSGKLENGTGLGEGEGAEDISKDIGEDEDLSELAQNADADHSDEEIDGAEDAIDMGADDLKGQLGDADTKTDEEGETDQSEVENEDEMDEETGSVDELDPSAVDEKMWDDMKNEAETEKELKDDQAKGKKSEEQTASDGRGPQNEEVDELMEEREEENDTDSSVEEGEGTERPEADNVDPHLQDQKALDLPDELQLNGEEIEDDDVSDDGMDDLSDIEHPEAGDVDETEEKEPVQDKSHEGQSDNEGEEIESGIAQDDEIMEDQPGEDEDQDEEGGEEEGRNKDQGLDTHENDVSYDLDQSPGGESGAANQNHETVDLQENAGGMNQAESEADLPQQSRPTQATDPENQERGETGKGTTEREFGRDSGIERKQNEALKRLADLLDRWHNRREILPASKTERQQGEADEDDVDMADADFEHVGDEDEGDAQALGAATAEQVQNLDKSRAIEDDDMPITDETDLPDVADQEQQEGSIADRLNRLQSRPKAGETRDAAGAFIPSQDQNQVPVEQRAKAAEATADNSPSPDVEQQPDVHRQQETLSPLTVSADAAQLWNHCSHVTHQYSLLLTEQLRLILHPTTATKLRGDFRTGKRLNLKRIIPYIASGYKRDKIWMRRSVPSKRDYQIMIAVDDSKSMSESGADLLAFETLAMLCKSLSMLEAGDICVVSFGDQQDHLRVAHPFGTPFRVAADGGSGVDVFSAFSFAQKGTDVRKLVAESITLFQDARLKSTHQTSASSELWQLELIVSDGHCSDHDAIRRLVRKAQEEKIMIVFVIVDAGPESIVDLKEAIFEWEDNGEGRGEMKVRTKRYLEDFPFPYYLVVRDVMDLPSVLATALKGWFGSVVDVQG